MDKPGRAYVNSSNFTKEDIEYLKFDPKYLKLFTLVKEENGTPYEGDLDDNNSTNLTSKS